MINRLSHQQLALTAALLLFCYTLLVSNLGWRDMWYDEVGDFLIAAEPLPDILTANKAGSLDPPLYYYFLHFWSAAAGRSEIALRFPSVLLVTLAVAITFSWARRWLGFDGGWTAALLLGIMPPVIYYAQEVNQYAGLTFFASLAVWIITRPDTTNQPNRQASLLFGLTSAAGLAWHYGFIWCWLSLNLVFLLGRPNRPTLLCWGIGQTIVVITGWILFTLVLDTQHTVGSIAVYLRHAYPSSYTLPHLFQFFGIAWLKILVFFLGGNHIHSMALIFTSVGLHIGGLVTGGLARLRSKHKASQPVIHLASLSAILMVASMLKLYPFYGGRHLMMLSPLFATVLAWAWLALPRPLARLGLLLVAVTFALCWPHQWAAGYSHGENTRALLAKFESNAQPDDGLFIYAESARTWRYYRPELPPGAQVGKWWAYNHYPDVLAEMDTAVADAPRTWLAFTRCLNEDGVCERLFETIPNRYCELSQWESGQSRLFLVQLCSKRGSDTGP